MLSLQVFKYIYSDFFFPTVFLKTEFQVRGINLTLYELDQRRSKLGQPD